MDKANVDSMIAFLLHFFCVTLQGGMEWPRNLPEGPELQASGLSCELDPEHFQKDTKDKLDPDANRSVTGAKAFYTLDCPSIEDKTTLHINTLELCVH